MYYYVCIIYTVFIFDFQISQLLLIPVHWVTVLLYDASVGVSVYFSIIKSWIWNYCRNADKHLINSEVPDLFYTCSLAIREIFVYPVANYLPICDSSEVLQKNKYCTYITKIHFFLNGINSMKIISTILT